MDDTLLVHKVEHHLWRTCPCGECVRERERRDTSKIPQDSRRSISVDAAHILGYIPSRNPHGSVARELMLHHGSG